MDKPLISIIVPVYNVAPYVEDCIRSVMRQTYDGKMECIVVDDCGTDDSMAIVERVIEDYNGPITFKILHHTYNRGLSVARNTGFDTATGEWVWFVDSDDWIENETMVTLVPILEAKDYDVICIQKNNYLAEDLSFLSVNNVLDAPILVTGKQYLKSNLQKCVVQKFIIRRDFLKVNNITFYPNILHEDDLYVRILMYLAKNVYVLNLPLYNKRQKREGSIMNLCNVKNAYDMIVIHQQLIEFMNSYVDEKDKEWFFMLSFYSIVNAYEKIDRFYATNAYSEFQRINAKYISDICKQAFHYGRMGFKLIALIILVSPHYYKYYSKIRSTIGVWMKR